MTVDFKQAQPVWPKGRLDVWNQMAGFRLSWESSGQHPGVFLRVTGGDCCRIWCNGRYTGAGPARAAHGYSRVDEWALDDLVQPGLNNIAIEVLNYGIDSYAYAMQSPFLQAEVVQGGTVAVATGEGSRAYLLAERIQKVERYSKQRPFAEAYRLASDCNDWRVSEAVDEAVECETVAQPLLLPRGVRLPDFDKIFPQTVVAEGEITEKSPVPEIAKCIQRNGVGVRVMGYPVDELEIDMTAELNRMDFREDGQEDIPFVDGMLQTVPASGHALYDFGIVQGGFIGIRVSCKASTRLYLMYDEIRDRGERSFVLGVGAVVLDLEPGVHDFESMEPYTFRFLRVIAVDAALEVESLYVREYANPAADKMQCPDDAELAKIFRAGRQTFRTNSIDLFTDCMSRERGGYPCDSWFTARAERVLAGESLVERNFLENYFLVDKFQSIPAGMVPHCYPSDRLGKGQYIPNWGLWLVYELCEYYQRTGDDQLRELARPRVEALFNWFAPSINEMGLLEDIPGWIFVEWSPANDCTGAVNHPTNMLYAQCLASAGETFERPEWVEQAEEVRSSVRRESWDGKWFADQSVRIDGQLRRGDVRSETCQYHALYFGIADRDSHKELWTALRDNWGPRRGMRMKMAGKGWERCYDDGVAPRPDDLELAPAGLLYGLMLRFDLLMQYSEWDMLIEEVCRVFGPQAEQTGTLWEHFDSNSSCNHGFASCACEYLQAALQKKV